MKMKWGLIAVLVIAVGFGTWYVASPWLALNSLKSAAEAGESSELQSRVDFPAVRESMKSQLKAEMAVELAKDKDTTNPFNALGSILAMGMVDGMIETFVTPEAISNLIKQHRLKKPDAGSATNPNTVKNNPGDWSVKRTALDKFSLVDKSAKDDPPELLFELRGLTWKLVGIRLGGRSLSKMTDAEPEGAASQNDPSVGAGEPMGDKDAMSEYD
jgi:hypothetical protein